MKFDQILLFWDWLGVVSRDRRDGIWDTISTNYDRVRGSLEGCDFLFLVLLIWVSTIAAMVSIFIGITA